MPMMKTIYPKTCMPLACFRECSFQQTQHSSAKEETTRILLKERVLRGITQHVAGKTENRGHFS